MISQHPSVSFLPFHKSSIKRLTTDPYKLKNRSVSNTPNYIIFKPVYFLKKKNYITFCTTGYRNLKNVFEQKKDEEIVVNKSWHGKFDNRGVRRQDVTVLQ